MVRKGKLAVFESSNISKTKEVTHTKIGVHAFDINPYLHAGLGSITNWQLQLRYQLQAKHNYQLQLQLHSYRSSTITNTITRHLVAMTVKDSTSHVVIPGGNCKIE